MQLVPLLASELYDPRVTTAYPKPNIIRKLGELYEVRNFKKDAEYLQVILKVRNWEKYTNLLI